MNVWLVSEGNCECCMYVVAAFTSEEKANEYEAKTESKYTDVYCVGLDEE